VAEVGETGDEHRTDQLFHILYDGTVMDEQRFSVLGGEADEITQRVESSWRDDLTLEDSLPIAVSALAGPDRSLVADDLEVAVLRRTNGRRAFRRVEGEALEALVPAPSAPPATDERPNEP